jgi:hypothetical protein
MLRRLLTAVATVVTLAAMPAVQVLPHDDPPATYVTCHGP